MSDFRPKYTSKDEIVRDVTFILSAPVSDATKAIVLKRAIWSWTEWDGKHVGCRFWTTLAQSTFSEGTTRRKRLLRHEHVVPLKVLKRMLVSLRPPSLDSVQAVFEQFVIAAVVHRSEHDALDAKFKCSMPPEFDDPQSQDFQNPWLRYEVCQIVPLDCGVGTEVFKRLRHRRFLGDH